MDSFLAWVEDGWLSTLLREGDYLFAGVLTVHIVSVALVAGISLPISLRLLGFLPGVPTASFKRYLPIFWTGLVTSALSGTLLLIAYPTKSLTNPLFYFKMAAIAAAVGVAWTIRGTMRAPEDLAAQPRRARSLAITSLGLWAFTIVAGRLLAYTYGRLMVGF